MWGFAREKFSQRFPFPSCLFRSSSVGKLVVYFLHRHAFSATFSTVAGPTREKMVTKTKLLYMKRSSWGVVDGCWSGGEGGVLVGGLQRESFGGQSTESKFIYSVSDGRVSSPFEALTIRRQQSRCARRTPRVRVAATIALTAFQQSTLIIKFPTATPTRFLRANR